MDWVKFVEAFSDADLEALNSASNQRVEFLERVRIERGNYKLTDDELSVAINNHIEAVKKVKARLGLGLRACKMLVDMALERK